MYDGKFIPKPVIEIKEKPARNNVPYIVGCNNTEGHGIMNNNILNDFKTGITKETFDHMLRNFLGISFCVSCKCSIDFRLKYIYITVFRLLSAAVFVTAAAEANLGLLTYSQN